MKQFWHTISRNIVAPSQLNGVQFLALLAPFNRSPHLRRHAASVIIVRVRLISALFAVLVPLWSLVDVMVFPATVAVNMMLVRLISAAAFTALAWPREISPEKPYRQAVIMLLAMLMVPPLFYLLSMQIIDPSSLDATQQLVAQLYAFMPTVVLGGLAIFPLTALETLLFSTPVVGAAVAGMLLGGAHFSLADHGAALWFMSMMIGVAAFSGMSQCHYMATLVYKAMTDPLTGAYTRQSGAEALELMYRLNSMADKPLSVVFLDLDHFKAINDNYGHEAGDNALRTLAERIAGTLRRSDILIRWGGEEFVVVLPDTPVQNVVTLLRRLRQGGFGLRPDGAPITASIGIAESQVDKVSGWPELIARADERMYEAKHGGRDCVVLPDNSRIALNGLGA